MEDFPISGGKSGQTWWNISNLYSSEICLNYFENSHLKMWMIVKIKRLSEYTYLQTGCKS